ncbi:sulfite exporter TauE/SafE family protein [Clostridium sp. CM028]|uniref:sulfite exporter TauE/SafE family protein n=1 Tax=unclassified Clostridium TaxID=2614128 RepID=UPI001C0C4CB3|nr:MULTISPECIES: sulfite exporter TauE/SafE family protein [unclassified Clostridium]MBU3092006.1 sulfite exporter TauE/SafE family protein [Clostridium sp. CF011]MBW9146593.1 sulfite exporter TauE/SafE family protein [Clostridium sp. CM027]MBW9150269.1 sulfite exporter TauE/SafE family protein [Clostridium sp. CM028]UVE42275.1 sulfite exporter TauE/SafE family protein [Clostridium sp. CM027]WAG71292.1 sulfite exporter TauE/SafE family protein [Clostridium sp. CF011]
MGIIHMFNLSTMQWICLIISAVLVGVSKTGISGFLMPVIPIIASVFGGKESTGVILPILVIGDVFAVYYYNRHAKWENIKKLLPWTIIGLLLGVIVGNFINDKQFKAVISISVLLCLVALIYTEKKGENIKVPTNKWFYAMAGIATGFTSMIGNAAGPIFSVYLLTMNFKKNDFMGTTAWFFLLVNLAKLPLQILFWHNIAFKTVLLSIGMVPAIALGALLGMLMIKKINEKNFRYIIIIMTFIAAVRLLV